MKGEFTVKVVIPEWQVENMVRQSVLHQLKSQTNKTAILVVEDMVAKGINSVDLKDMIQSGVIAYLEKYSIKEIVQESIRGILVKELANAQKKEKS